MTATRTRALTVANAMIPHCTGSGSFCSAGLIVVFAFAPNTSFQRTEIQHKSVFSFLSVENYKLVVSVLNVSGMEEGEVLKFQICQKRKINYTTENPPAREKLRNVQMTTSDNISCFISRRFLTGTKSDRKRGVICKVFTRKKDWHATKLSSLGQSSLHFCCRSGRLLGWHAG